MIVDHIILLALLITLLASPKENLEKTGYVIRMKKPTTPKPELPPPIQKGDKNEIHHTTK